MSELMFREISNQIDMLSYGERLRLLNKIVGSLQLPAIESVKKIDSDFDDAFGLWADRDVSLDEIRAKAWGRS